MAKSGKTVVCKCINSFNIEIDRTLFPLFKRSAMYSVIISTYKGEPFFHVLSRKEYSWTYVCEKKDFDKYFILVNNSKAILKKVKVKGGELRRDLEDD